jgi:hypothetical protein
MHGWTPSSSIDTHTKGRITRNQVGVAAGRAVGCDILDHKVLVFVSFDERPNATHGFVHRHCDARLSGPHGRCRAISEMHICMLAHIAAGAYSRKKYQV